MNNIVLEIDCYNMLELITNIVAALATTAAVIVALWQTTFPYKRKLNITNSVIVQMLQYQSGIANKAYYYAKIEVYNIGNRDTTIVDYGFYFSKKFKIQALNLNNNAPCKLSSGEFTTYLISYKDARDALQRNIDDIGRKTKKLKFYVTDTSGRTYCTKTNKTLLYYLNLKDDDLFVSIDG